MKIIKVEDVNIISLYIDEKYDELDYKYNNSNALMLKNTVALRNLLFKSKIFGLYQGSNYDIKSLIIFKMDDSTLKNKTKASIMLMNNISSDMLKESTELLFDIFEDVEKISLSLIRTSNKEEIELFDEFFTEIEKDIAGIKYRYYAKFRK